MDDGLTDGAVDSLPFSDCDELLDVNPGLADVGVVVDLPTDFWPLGVRSRCGCCRLPSAGLLRAYIFHSGKIPGMSQEYEKKKSGETEKEMKKRSWEK